MVALRANRDVTACHARDAMHLPQRQLDDGIACLNGHAAALACAATTLTQVGLFDCGLRAAGAPEA
jgi:hypothetical protein